jgi:hypothetical protein
MRALLFAVALLFSLLPAALQAHGGGAPRVSGEQAGSYLIYVWTEPDPLQVGQVHFTVGVTTRSANGSETPVTDADVSVTLQSQSTPASSVKLRAEPGAGGGAVYYEADTNIEQAGDWLVSVEVAGDQGNGDVAFAVTIAPASTGSQWVFLIAGLLLFVLVIAVFLLFGRTKARARNAGGQSNR